MKKIFLITIVSALIFACNSKKSETDLNSNANLKSSAETTIDTLKSNKVSELLNMITKYGNLIELKTYNVGKFKSIKFKVVKMTNINSSDINIFAKIEINYEDRYYYYTESAFILQEEIQDFINGIETIKNKYTNSTEDTETIAAYISSGDVRIRAMYENNRWRYDFHVNHRKDDTKVYFTKDDFDDLIAMFKKTDEKINELKNK